MFSFIFTNKTKIKMTQIEVFLQEFEAEAITTRKMLALVPTDKFTWQPHTKSMTLYSLASHIADIASWVQYAIISDAVDISNADFATPKMNSTAEILAYFEDCQAKSVAELKNADESKLGNKWQLTYGDQILMDITKAGCIRHSISQIIHHRAQLGVYLRLLDIPIPGSYGPSADEMGG
jgi:uncharacterized damage-inducible protein DinB